MTHWFLSLFRLYRDLCDTERDLRTRLNEADRRTEQATLECNSWREQSMWMRDAMMTAQSEARSAIQSVANIEYQRRYGWVPYPQSPSIPEKWFEDEENRPVTRNAPTLPFQERQMAFERFRKQAVEIADKAFARDAS